MKRTTLKILLPLFLLSMIWAGCDKNNEPEKLPLNHAKGTIIDVTTQCYGEVVLIEVDNPQGIGTAGTFNTLEEDTKPLTYQNAIGVPYFSKIGIPDSVPQTIGTKLYFTYRELTEEERQDPYLFSPNPPAPCYTLVGPPSAKRYIITKIISYQ
ncbi:hypothetical protein [Prolixibacter sp. NT017]|uniref:hypothetical protein n=1 Tax=Prolixibacter sp. NT017 TaxID=2652390 RepID=UPI001278EBD8|nr:hypothetical protein [Prolixibacter sp. NT017]GET24790.1 hypothetical protein NT017_11190 [Prolixibacter sp. NT017]